MYRLIGDTHTLDGLPHAAQEFLRAFDSLRRQLAIDAGVSGTELRALSRVAEETSLTPKGLADFLELSTPAVTAITNTLVDRGLLQRAAHPTDRRSLLLELTTEGHTVMETMYKNFQGAITGASAGLDAPQLALVDEALLHLAEGVARATADGAPDLDGS